MEARPDAHGLRRLRVVLVVECPRLAHDRVSGDPYSDVRDATLSGDCFNTLKIFGPTKLADFVNRPPLSKPSPRRNRHHRGAAFSRGRPVFDGHPKGLTPMSRKSVDRAARSVVSGQCAHAWRLPARVVQPLEGS